MTTSMVACNCATELVSLMSFSSQQQQSTMQKVSVILNSEEATEFWRDNVQKVKTESIIESSTAQFDQSMETLMNHETSKTCCFSSHSVTDFVQGDVDSEDENDLICWYNVLGNIHGKKTKIHSDEKKNKSSNPSA